MNHPDGWTEGDGDLPFLPKQDGFDGIRRFFEDLYAATPPPLRFLCTACDGDGRIAHRDEAEHLWNMSCPCCDGSGSMTIVPERRGTR